MSYEEATTIPLGLGTAFSSLFAEFPHGAGLPTPFTPEGQQAGAGKTIFIIGGSSSVGQYSECMWSCGLWKILIISKSHSTCQNCRIFEYRNNRIVTKRNSPQIPRRDPCY